MDVNKLALKVIKYSVSLIIMIGILMLLIQGGRKAFSFGRAIFDDHAMTTEEDARTVAIKISQGDSALDIGKMLERRGMIDDAYVFFVQSYCYEAGRKMQPGEYELSTDMDAKEIMNAIVSQHTEQTDNSGE